MLHATAAAASLPCHKSANTVAGGDRRTVCPLCPPLDVAHKLWYHFLYALMWHMHSATCNVLRAACKVQLAMCNPLGRDLTQQMTQEKGQGRSQVGANLPLPISDADYVRNCPCLSVCVHCCPHYVQPIG